MPTIIPDVQIGTLGGTLLWIGFVVLIVIGIFTVGLVGPLLIAGVAIAVVIVLVYLGGRRLMFRLTRPNR